MNKVIIITGASSGFGKSIAERLAKKGHRIYGICRRQMTHPNIVYMQGDIRDTARIEQIAKEIYEKEKRIDVLINNAGMGLGGALELTNWDEIKLQMETNFYGCVNVCQKYFPTCASNAMEKSLISALLPVLKASPTKGSTAAQNSP